MTTTDELMRAMADAALRQPRRDRGREQREDATDEAETWLAQAQPCRWCRTRPRVVDGRVRRRHDYGCPYRQLTAQAES